ncbi:hypothetical protein QAD02_011257 [Eretmocerus hayati]|uniref:Uncharacterized protein n=1 Tax=Eretmocerus hayati TaxID=131215 RepID=A0ACC2NWD7_9HYME|nr:hypothetical protein QAD02_011257 [Eretmocerus hayati]
MELCSSSISFLEINGIKLENSGIQFPLHLAAEIDDHEVMRFLIDKRIYDVDELDDFGLTPLFIAVSHGNFATAVELVRSGANFDIPVEKVSDEDPSRNCMRTPLSKAIVMTGLLQELSELNPRIVRRHLGTSKNEHVPDYSVLIKKCSAQFELLKTKNLFESMTLYDLLIGKDFSRFVQNEKVIAVMESPEIYELSDIYARRLIHSFSIAEVRRRAMDGAVNVLSELLGFDLISWPLILHTVMLHLSLKDPLNLSTMNKR